ncbi:MAG: bestrophin family ion channel [Fulvivirga sp.]
MQAGKRYSFPQVLNWTKKYILIFIVVDSIPVALYYFLDLDWLIIPWQPISLVGIAVAFYLGFKNNSSYERLWEARKIWGGIVNTSRSLTVMARDFITNEFASEKLSDEALHSEHKTIVHRHVAWLRALALQLRKLQPWEHNAANDQRFREHLGLKEDSDFKEIKPYLSEQDYQYVMNKGNKASHLLSIQSSEFKKLKAKGLIDDFRHMELQGLITELYALQGKSERIKNFPFPRQYASANFYFVCIFILLLPLGMLSIFTSLTPDYLVWLAVPFSVLSSWVFWMMEMIGEYSENPFEGLYNDVPITSMAVGIEIDIRQMLEETDLPEPMKPLGDFQILY